MVRGWLERFLGWLTCVEGSFSVDGASARDHADGAFQFATSCGWSPTPSDQRRVRRAIGRLDAVDAEVLRHRSLALAGWSAAVGLIAAGWAIGVSWGPADDHPQSAHWYMVTLALAAAVAIEIYVPARRLLLATSTRSVQTADALLREHLPGYTPLDPSVGSRVRMRRVTANRPSRRSSIGDVLLVATAVPVAVLALIGEALILLLMTIAAVGWKQMRAV
ncbi:hypothetical protein [Tsukamurella paurometabola]|uniref:Integral membrane protein n=1 Tax=Tsukamurella paurometabola TaxID=2061 RepID=A0ABS5NIY3_TSUPA|nr:hypothetical protein [Tsukamurella paurometabola]MBS4104233.1 hypothetical protein [Tsukamurella paurometabola]